MTRFQRLNLALGMIILAVLTAAALRAGDPPIPPFHVPVTDSAPAIPNS